MDILNQAVALMNRKEVKNFKIFIKKGWENEDRKDVKLFDYIRKTGPSYSDEKAYNRLYECMEKNAFYRLKNRLMESINLSLHEQFFNENDLQHSLFLISIAAYYSSKGNDKLALFHLKKAEKKAKHTENYSLMDIVYAAMINAAREVNTENPQKYITKRRENRSLLVKVGEIDDILEEVEYNVMISQNLSSSPEGVPQILQATLDRFAEDNDLNKSPRLQFGIYFITSRILLKNKDYAALEDYLSHTYKRFNEIKLFNKSNHAHKLQMLSWLINALFMNKKYCLSLEFANELKKQMLLYEALLYNRFEFFYYNALVINFSVINPEKAINILLDLSSKEKMAKLTFNGVFVYSNLALLYYAQKKYSKALKALNQLYAYEGFKATDEKVKFKIVLGELIMRYELGERDILEYRLKQLDKEFSVLLNESLTTSETEIFYFIAWLNEPQLPRTHKEISATAKILAEKMRINTNAEDILFGYDAWLKDKVGIH